jgi:UDP-glucose 4-epimerase
MQKTNSSVLVTGGAGFIGSHLVDYLLEIGCRVTVLDNFRNGTLRNLDKASASCRCKIIKGDILDPTTCRKACQDQEYVMHLACLGVRHSLHNPLENHQVNALGTMNILEACREAGVRHFLYVSTSEVYGRATDFPICEKTATWPLTVYGASKLAGEHYTRAYSECFGLRAVRVRTFNNYGTRAHFEGDAGEVIPRFILRALTGKPPIIFGDGSHTRDFLHVQDCVQTLWKIVNTDSLMGELINLGYGCETRIDTLASIILKAVGREDLKPVFQDPRPADVPRLWVDVSRLKSFIDFQPQISLEKGIQDVVPYYRELLEKDPNCLNNMQTLNWKL